MWPKAVRSLKSWGCRKQHTRQGVWNPRQSTPVSMSTQQATLNVLTAKLRSVRLWRSRFNHGSRCLRTFHTFWSRFPTLWRTTFHKGDTHENLSRFWSAPTSLLPRFAGKTTCSGKTCLLAMLLFIFLNKCSCPNLMATGSLQGQRSAFQPETYFNWFGPKILVKEQW